MALGGLMPTLGEWLNAVSGKPVLGTFVGDAFAVAQRPIGQGVERVMFFRDKNGKWCGDQECDVSGCIDARAIMIHESYLTPANLKALYP